MRSLRLARLDARLQLRQGFYAAYALVSAAYIALLRALPDEAGVTLAPLVIFSDPAVFGFFCAGALLLLERDEGVHAALFTTPARPAEYVLARMASLSLLALLTSFAIALGAGIRFEPVRLGTGVALTASLFTAIGTVAGCRSTTFNRFAVGGGLSIVVLAFPLPVYLGWFDVAPLAVLPSYASLVLIGGAYGLAPAGAATAAFATTWLLLCCAAAFVAARRAVERHLVHGIPA
jgi:fluoroquinolone transport system permease protein